MEHTCGGGGGVEHEHVWGGCMERTHVWGRRNGTYTRVGEEEWNIHTCGVWGMEYKHTMDKVFSIAT